MAWSRKYNFILLLLLCLSFNGLAQGPASAVGETPEVPVETAEPAPLPAKDEYLENPVKKREVSEDNWTKAKDGIDYINEKKKEEPEKSKPPEGSSSPGMQIPMLNLAGPLQAILFIGLIAVLVFIVYKLIAAHVSNKAVPRREYTSLEDIEENLIESDLERAIREALEKKNYKLAIRLYYLAIIKELSLKRLIEWKKDKTNLEYLREMGPKALYPSFREVTLTFEKAWYGDFEVMEAEYQLLSPQFRNFLDKINHTQ